MVTEQEKIEDNTCGRKCKLHDPKYQILLENRNETHASQEDCRSTKTAFYYQKGVLNQNDCGSSPQSPGDSSRIQNNKHDKLNETGLLSPSDQVYRSYGPKPEQKV